MQLARFSHGVMQPSLYLSCLRFDVIEEEKQADSPRYLHCLVISCTSL